VVAGLKLPAASQGDNDLSFTVSPDKKIYVAIGSKVYAASGSGDFQDIYDGRPAGSTLLPGSNKIGLLTNGYQSDTHPNLTVIDGSGQQLASHDFKSFVSVWSAWSPHDSHIFTSSGSVGEVWNGSLDRVGIIPQANISNPVWLNDNTLFYSVNDQLWSYSLKSQKSSLIANTPLAAPISSLAISTDGSYVYLSTVGGTGESAIRRVGIKNQKAPDYLYKLQSFLPVTFDSYSLGLVNFNGPTVVVQPNPDTDPQADLTAAQKTLHDYGFDVSKIRFKVEAAGI
jgi:hypothetical protein